MERCLESADGEHSWVRHPDTGYEYCRMCDASKPHPVTHGGTEVTFEVRVRGRVIKVVGHAPPAAAAEAVLDQVEMVWGQVRPRVVLALKELPLPQDWLRY